MEEDDDDFYGGGGNAIQRADNEPIAAELPVKMEQDGDSQNEDEDEEEDEDVERRSALQRSSLTIHSSRPPFKTVQSHDRTSSVDIKAGSNVKANTAVKQESTPARRAESIAPQVTKGTLTFDGKEGKDFPEVRTSTLDINAIPTWPTNGKLITDLDIDADLAEHSKPWRLPGTDQTDFFNYGFDEYNWVQYCMRQQQMGGLIESQKAEDAQMKAMLGGMGGGPPGGGGGMPPGMPAMPGMPGMEDMQRMMQQMAAQGMDPTQIPFEQMMQMMNGSGGAGFGSGGNSASPAPGPGQGFQPPTGPQGGMDGYSEQQMAIMQGAGGRGGRGGRRGRGSGYWFIASRKLGPFLPNLLTSQSHLRFSSLHLPIPTHPTQTQRTAPPPRTGFSNMRGPQHAMEWKMEEMRPSKSDINWIIMDYLVSEGYPGAAEKFAQETSICNPTDVTNIRERVEIRKAIQSGDIAEAIGLMNAMDPEVRSFQLSSLAHNMIIP
nr:pre-mrna polyadenylation factor fip1 [Quercus suber]